MVLRLHTANRFCATLFACAAIMLCPELAISQLAPNVPATADPSRIAPKLPGTPSLSTPSARVSTDNVLPSFAIPGGAEDIYFMAKGIEITGATQFKDADFSGLIDPWINKKISVADVYRIAYQITLRYRAQGYLLSYAYVPDQQIVDGRMKVAVVEGYIADIKIDGEDPNRFITRQYEARIMKEKPLKEDTLESNLLRINDLPGRSYRAILSKPTAPALDAFTLTLVPQKKAPRASFSFDNFSSRYLGPHEVSANLSGSIAPLQQTSLSVLNSIPFDRLNYVQLNHSIQAFPDVTLDATGSYAHSKPEFRIEPLDIDSTTIAFSGGLNYQALRQRDENLLLGLRAASRHVTSDIFTNSLLTRDEIRTINASLSYDRQDNWRGANIVNLNFTQGVPILGASKKGDSNLSRGEARPDFSKAELTLSRYQAINDDFSLLLQSSGQLSSGQLYASEEFGIGGQTFGRAYDNSEIVGDNGLSGLIELRYQGFRTLQPINFEPFVFADSGFVTNTDASQEGYETLTSVGGGVRFASDTGQAGMVGVAVPLSKNPDAPIYGLKDQGPRILLQFSQQF